MLYFWVRSQWKLSRNICNPRQLFPISHYILVQYAFLAAQVALQFSKIVSTGADRQLPKLNASQVSWKDRPSSSICAKLCTMEFILMSSGKIPRSLTWAQKKMPSSWKKMISFLFSVSDSQLLQKRSCFLGTCDPHHPS